MTDTLVAIGTAVILVFLKPFAEKLAQAIMPDPTKVIRLVKIFIITTLRYGTPIFFIVYYYWTYDFDRKFVLLMCVQFLALAVQLTIDIVSYLTRPYSAHIEITRDIIDTQKQMQIQIQRTAESHIKLVDKIIDALEGRQNNNA